VGASAGRHLAHLIDRLGPSVRYVVVCALPQRGEIERWLDAANVPIATTQFVNVPSFDITLWAQDAYVCLRPPLGPTILCEGVSFARLDDMSIADDVAAQTDTAAIQSYLYFQGGNILGGSDLTLIGMDYIWRNTERYNLPSRQSVLDAFAGLFGTPVIALGGLESAEYDWLDAGILSGVGFQPIFHIDMYVTRTGVLAEDGVKEIVFLGRPSRSHAVTERWSEIDGLDGPTLDAFFDETAAQLSVHFEVRTLPLWWTYGDLGYVNWGKEYYALTWNNALVQNNGTTRRVLLPNYADPDDCKRYGLDFGLRLDLQNAAIKEWRDLKFDVQLMDGLEDLAWGQGAVHCMSKVLER
jgi:hypothetical protein